MKLKAIMKNNALMIAASVILAITLAYSVFYKLELTKNETIIAQIEPDNCDLQKHACSLAIPGGGKITLSITPRPIPLLTKFDITVDIESIEANGITIDFQGTTMNMGLNRVDLKPHTNNRYKGNGVLPVCILNSMEWKALVYVKTDAGMYVAPFIFVTHK
ncbi:MAG: hypothetical protein OQL06_12210 [Gammaproteobacteria bacterium]|nr:hypothetical protein [Gammaproteobacteria bacterium]